MSRHLASLGGQEWKDKGPGWTTRNSGFKPAVSSPWLFVSRESEALSRLFCKTELRRPVYEWMLESRLCMSESLEPRKWQSRPDMRGFYLECGPIFRLKSLERALEDLATSSFAFPRKAGWIQGLNSACSRWRHGFCRSQKDHLTPQSRLDQCIRKVGRRKCRGWLQSESRKHGSQPRGYSAWKGGTQWSEPADGGWRTQSWLRNQWVSRINWMEAVLYREAADDWLKRWIKHKECQKTDYSSILQKFRIVFFI